jgi:hypothetical protein
MARRKVAKIASPTIAEVLETFLDEQARRVGRDTFSKYEKIVRWLQNCMNGYAYLRLDKENNAFFDRHYDATGAEHREFCEVFGPEHILRNVSEFLDEYMVRKVWAGPVTLRAAGTVTKRLAKWLADKGYVEADDAALAVEHGAEAARELPQADELATLLFEFTDAQELGEAEERIQDRFTLARVEPGKVWLVGMLDGRSVGPIALPEDITRRCKIGWAISGVAGRVNGRWHLIGSANVYPR